MNIEWLVDYEPIIFAVVWGLVLVIGGAWATDIGEWYKTLQQPRWKPPDWLFGPMWTTIFICAGTSFVKAYNRAPDDETIRILIILFIVNGFFNLLWSILYFRMHRPDWALIEAIGLWLSVLAILLAPRSYSPISSWLIAPYLIWVTTAMFLNWTNVKLNGPFDKQKGI
jgi:tryptophan-rich sensory protein